VVVNGFQGSEYSSSQSVRNEIFRPKVSAIIDIVLGRTVSYSVQGRAGEVSYLIFSFSFSSLCIDFFIFSHVAGFFPL